ncbi:MAG: glycosyl hydrolase family protein, partial [Verrucomicrobia bacterium]
TGIDTTDYDRPFHIDDIGFNLTDDFHVYGLEWTPEVCRFYVDGRLVRTADTLDFKIGINILVGLEFNKWLSGKEASEVVDSDIERGGAPVNYLVDYVRTWIQPEREPRILYVDAVNGSDEASGLSWAEAKKSINRAVADALAGDTIWVAGGTYPDHISIHGVRNLRILGGFQPGATDAAERDPAAHPVIVDAVFGHAGLSVTSTENVVLDGLTFRGTTRSWSAGLDLKGPIPDLTLRRCDILENTPADGAGGGCFIAADNGPIAVSFENCTFADNSVLGAYPSGGAVAGRGTFTARFHGCRFLRNTARAAGGAINLANSGSLIHLSNCLFVGNRVLDGLATIEATSGSLLVDNCTFHTANKAHLRLTSAGSIAAPARVTNTLFTGAAGTALDLSGLPEPTHTLLRNCLFDANGTHVRYTAALQSADAINALTFAEANQVADPLYTDADAGDFTLTAASPAIDAGTIDTAPPIDIAGLPRPIGGAPDIGAHERYLAPPSRYRLVNISTRGIVGEGDSKMIGGFVVNGTQPKTVLIRGIGPSLGALGVANTMDDPVLHLIRDGLTPTPVAENDNWEQQPDATAIIEASRFVGAFPLAANSRDAALLITVAPGSYTVHLENRGTQPHAVGLIEVYEFR